MDQPWPQRSCARQPFGSGSRADWTRKTSYTWTHWASPAPPLQHGVQNQTNAAGHPTATKNWPPPPPVSKSGQTIADRDHDQITSSRSLASAAASEYPWPPPLRPLHYGLKRSKYRSNTRTGPTMAVWSHVDLAYILSWFYVTNDFFAKSSKNRYIFKNHQKTSKNRYLHHCLSEIPSSLLYSAKSKLKGHV